MDFLAGDKLHEFETKSYSDNFLNYNILNRKKVIGRYFLKNEKMDVGLIEIYDVKLQKKLGFSNLNLINGKQINTL
jgi:hypothetical protein